MDANRDARENQGSQFAEEASKPRRGAPAEFFDFLMCNKKWWIAPIVLVLLAVSLLVFLGSTGAAPFIYTIF
jgi:hypothetical protein